MLLGAPSAPMPVERSDAIAALVASLPGVTEAHLPQCFVVGEMDKPAQILAIAFKTKPSQQALDTLGKGLKNILPSGEHLDVWPLTPTSSMLADVRQANCRIYSRPQKRSWWPFRKSVTGS